MLLEQRQSFEAWRCNGHLEVVTAAGAVFDPELGCVRKCSLEQHLQWFRGHAGDRSYDLKASASPADTRSVAIRLLFLVAVVVGVGFMTGTFNTEMVTSVTSHIPRGSIPSAQERQKEEYREVVRGNFSRLGPLNNTFVNECSPDPKVASTCVYLSQQMLGGLGALRTELEKAEVPTSFEPADSTLRRGLAKAVEGFTYVQRGVRTHKQADWLRARNALRESDRLVQAAYLQLPAADRPPNWGF
jgi:hypothetical protein